MPYCQTLMKKKKSKTLPKEPPKSQKFGNALRMMMEMAGLDVNGLGEKTGLDRTLVSRHLNGHIFPHLRTRKEYATALKIPFSTFEEKWRVFGVQPIHGGPGIPVINKSPAGEIIDYHEANEGGTGIGRFYIERGGITDPLAFAAIITGDSMTGELEEGDEAIFAPLRMDGTPISGGGPSLHDGEIVHARFTSESKNGCTVAYFYKLGDGRIELRKKNPRCRGTICGPEELSQISVLMEFRRKPAGRQLRQHAGYVNSTMQHPSNKTEETFDKHPNYDE